VNQTRRTLMPDQIRPGLQIGSSYLLNAFRKGRWPVLILIALTALSVASSTSLCQRRGQSARPGEATAKSATAKYFALIIGNNDYQSPLNKLHTAVNDARELDRLLREAYGFQTRLLLNARRDEILDALNDYRATLDEQAYLLVYYAGHGVYDRDVGTAYWLPVDARQNNNSRWISADDVTTNIKGIPAAHVLVISDSCYSGKLNRGTEAAILPAERQRLIDKLRKGRSRLLIASGGNEPVDDSGGDGHSVFANALLRGLRRIESDEFTSSELFYTFILQQVAGKSAQTPEYGVIRNSGHDSGDFVFARRKSTGGGAVSPTLVTMTNPVYRGDALAEEERWADAESAYRRELESAPNNGLIKFKLMLVLVAETQNAAATEIRREFETGDRWGELEKEIRRERDKGVSARTEYALGYILYWQKRYMEAETALKEATRLNPRLAAPHSQLGAIYASQKKYAEAEAEYKEAMRLDPKWASAYNNLGIAYKDQQKYAEAEATLKEALRLDPKWAIPHSNLGSVYREQKRYAEAEAEYKEAIRLDPKWAVPHGGLAVVYFDQRKYAEAEAGYKEAIRLDPKWAGVHNSLGSVYGAQQRYIEAEAQYREAVRLDAKWAVPHNNLGSVYREQKRYAEAEAEYKEAIRLDPKLASPHTWLGIMYQDHKKRAAAEIEFKVAIRLDPKSAVPHNGLGNVYADQKKYVEAEAEFMEALRLDPSYTNARDNMEKMLKEKKH
jgi:Tfp pilus assembly protein PilF